MSDAALRRTLRRCTALLLVPLSLRIVQFRHFHASNGEGWRLLARPVTFWLPGLLMLCALAYLVGSVLSQGAAADAERATAEDE